MPIAHNVTEATHGTPKILITLWSQNHPDSQFNSTAVYPELQKLRASAAAQRRSRRPPKDLFVDLHYTTRRGIPGPTYRGR